MKEREEKNSGRKKKVRKKSRTTEFSITVVLCCLVAVLTVKGISFSRRSMQMHPSSSLDSQIEEEKQRTDDITALKEYMQTDEYIEKTAREKLGMVKDNEILFKESQSK